MARSTSKSQEGTNPGKTVAARGTAVAKTGGGAGDRRMIRFFREVRIEMSKVTWPPRPELIQSTIVVLVAVAIAAAYIGVFDLLWSSLVNLVRLGN